MHDVPATNGIAACRAETSEAALHRMLEEACRQAVQARLLALNVLLEGAACADAAAAGRGAALSVEEAQRLAAAVESLVQQIRQAQSFS